MSGFAERFLDRLEQAVAEAGGQKKFETLTGVKQQTLSGILAGKVAPSFKNMTAIIDALGEDVFFPVIKRTGVNSPVERVEGSGLPTVPVFGSTGAGEPCEFWSQEPERQIEVLPSMPSRDA